MKSKRQTVLSCVLAAAIALAGAVSPLEQTAHAADSAATYDPSQASPLLVTEVVTDGPSNSRYTYVEIYNNSTSTINFKDYHWYYMYPNDTYQDFTVSQDVDIASGKTLVLWMSDGKAKNNQGNTVAQFNSYYGTNLVENKDIVKINYGGIHSTAKRGYFFGKDLDSVVTKAYSNEHGDDIPNGNPDKLGIQYQYPTSGIVCAKQSVSQATPGSVDPTQVPAQKVDISSDKPAVKSVSASGSDSLTVTAHIQFGGSSGAMPVTLYYRQKKSDGTWQDYNDYDKVSMQWQSGDTFTGTIASSALFGSQVEWYVKVDNGPTQTAESDKQVSDVQPAAPAADKTAPLVVTEVAANPTSTDGGQYSYFEVYNQTDKPVNLSYYNIYYYYDYPAQTASASGKIWSISDFTVYLQPGQSMVYWLTSNGTTIDQFNNFYGTNLELDKNIIQVNYAGLHGSDPRWIRFGTSESTAFSLASFNQTPNEVTGNKTALQYASPRGDGSVNESIPVEVSAATPGTVADWQKPAKQSAFQGYANYPADDGQKPTLKVNETEGMTVPSSINEGEELKVMYDTDLLVGATSADRVAAFDDSKANADNTANEPGGSESLKNRPYLIGTEILYKLDDDSDWTVIQQKTQWRLGHFLMQIPSDILFGHDKVTFKVRAYTLYGMSETEESTVKINRLNDTDGTVRLNLDNQQVISGTTTVTANDGSDNKDTTVSVDGTEQTLTPMLEDGAYFSFTTSGMDNYFKDAITAPYGGNSRDIITILSPWCELPTERAVHIDNKYFKYNAATNSYDVTLTMWAGDSGTPFEEIYDVVANENHEDYSVSNVQLRLANGKSYLPTSIAPDNSKTNTSTALSASHTIGDSSGMETHMDATFSIPAADATAMGIALDTTKLTDGTHTVTATSGTKKTSVSVTVDNTAPTVNPGIEDGSTQTKAVTLLAGDIASDANGISDLAVSLDGEALTLPAAITPREMTAGQHTLKIVASDTAGNITTKEVTFTTANPDTAVSGAASSGTTTASTSLSVSLAGSGTSDVTFLQGRTIDASDITCVSGDGAATSDGLPYRLYTVNAGDTADRDTLSMTWSGSATNEDDTHLLGMYVYNLSTKKWELAGQKTKADTTIKASFTAQNHVTGGKAYVLVQCRPSGTTPELDPTGTTTTTSTGAVTVQTATDAADNWDGTSVPTDYDFSFAWETDTQYYSESFPYHYENMNKWIVDSVDALKIRYVIHTGDIVDDVDMTGEWRNADTAMSIFDKAGISYGVLGGNHDVYAGAEGYGNYWKYFGESRFKNQSTYGESYKNNLGHYDLLTENGQDFIVLYMSWDIYTDEINWMNQVLAKYKDRKAILCFHRYSNVSISNGSILDYTGKLIQDQVVKKNPNVFLVLNGHYHGASIQTDAFDDNGDGTMDRNVYQICTDYQSDAEGGSEYVKFLYFNLKQNKIYINSYSPYRKDFNYFDTARLSSYDAGTVAVNMDIADLNVPFDTTQQSVTETSVGAQVLTQNVIGTVKGAADSATCVWKGLSPKTTYGWYAHVTNAQGGVTDTNVTMLTTADTTSFAASAAAGDGQAALTWDAVSGADSYNVYQAGADGKMTQVHTGVQGTSAAVGGLTNGSSYSFQIRAVKNGDEIAVSNTVSVQPSATKTLTDGNTTVQLPVSVAAQKITDTIITASDGNTDYADIQKALEAQGYAGLAIHGIQLLDASGNPITKLEDGQAATVKIKIPDGASGNLRVLWYDPAAKKLTDMNARQENGYLVFETSHFSYYLVAQGTDTSSSSGTSSGSSSGSSSGASSSGASSAANPKTGAASAIPSAMLFYGAVAGGMLLAVSKKRKRK